MGIKIGTTYKMADKESRNRAIREYVTAHPGVKLREVAVIWPLCLSTLWEIIHRDEGKKNT